MRIAWSILCVVVSAPSASSVSTAGPAITSEQIEADWLRQDQLRNQATQSQPPPAQKVTPEQDAAGAVDGIKNGQWGFHTDNQNNPWWQVDLGKPTRLERLRLYNRCEGGIAERASRIMVLLSEDGKQFKKAYQHDGTTFYGRTDKKPLVVGLGGRQARYVRLQQPGKNWFHLDEVEIYAVGNKANIALGKPATQSSTSQWSTARGKAIVTPAASSYATGQVVERGLKLAENLKLLGVNTEPHEKTLRQVAEKLTKLQAGEVPTGTLSESQRAGVHAIMSRELYMTARWTVRKMALENPLLDFDTILFVKRAPGMFPHMSDQYYGWWSQPGGSINLLEGFKGEHPRVRCLTEDWPQGSFLRPDLSYDGKKVLFAYCKYHPHVADMEKVDKDKLPEDAFYQVYEMNLDGSAPRRLTRGRYDDFDARYLPNGDIVFLSTRKGQFVQLSKAAAEATTRQTLPDSYVRCGGGNRRPCAVYTLHRMDGDGGNLRPISAFENFEWTPSVAADGRVLYARWDYIDRFNGPFMSLWSTNPDGTNPQLVYGNFTKRPQCIFEARAIPNSHKLIFTAAAHHSNMGGSLVLLDRNYGTEHQRPIRRLTPEVPFPETEGWKDMYYANPYPLSEHHYLVAWSDRRLPRHCRFRRNDPGNPSNAMGIYVYDAFGNLNLLYRDPNISSMNPIPVRPRKRPPAQPSKVGWDGPQEGRFLLQDVYRGLPGIERGSVARLRIVGVPPKVQPQMNRPNLGVSAEDPGKFVLGTVPVENDGSAYFRVPSGVSLFFQALDGDGLAVQTMRTLTYVQAKQTLSCIGCHEHRDLAPVVTDLPLAALREPSKLTPGPEGSWPLRFDQLVQPVLEKLCVRCHRPGSDDKKAARFNLTAARSYQNLLSFGGKDLHRLAFERDSSVPGECVARKSKLLAILMDRKGHQDVHLDPDSLDRLATWMDTYAHRQGHFSPAQEEQLRQLRQKLAGMLAN